MSAACSTSTPSFDETLVERLDYRGPAILLEAVRDIAGPTLRIGSMLDLGCGTGLGGAAFRPHVDWLVGVDLSPAMIAKAREKGLYDRLAADDLRRVPRRRGGLRMRFITSSSPPTFFVYVNDLAPVTAAAPACWRPGRLFAFTVETHAGDGVVLQPTLRYAHGQPMCARRSRTRGLPPCI